MSSSASSEPSPAPPSPEAAGALEPPQGPLIRPLLLMFLAALAVRLLCLFFQAGSPFFGVPFLDELYFHQWAGEIASGRLMSDRVFFRAPLYAWLLGGVYRITGGDPYVVALIQHLAGAAAVVPLGFLALRLWGSRRVALIAAALAAFYAPSLYFEGQLLDIWLQQWMLPLTLLALFRAIRSPTRANHFLLGLIGGAGAIARPAALPFFALIVLLTLCRPLINRPGPGGAPLPFARAASLALILIAGLALPVLPVTLHNYRAEGVFVPISTYTGVNLWIGNNAAADGFTASTPERYPNFGRYEDSVELFARRKAEEVSGRRMNSKEIRDYWSGRAREEILGHPGRTLRLAFKKLVLFFNAREIKNNKNYDLYVSFNPVLAALSRVFNFGLIAPLAIVGLLSGFRRRPSPELICYALLLATLAAGVILFFVNVRYRYPFAFLMLPAGAAGLARLCLPAEDISRRGRAILWGVFAAALFAVNHDWYGLKGSENLSADYWSVANCHKERGHAAAALEWYDKSLAADPRNADAHNNRGETLYSLGRRAEAAEAFGRAAETSGADIGAKARAFNNLGVLAEEAGDLETAEARYRATLALAPGHALAWTNLGDVLSARGETAAAAQSYSSAIAAAPAMPLPRLGLARCMMRLGDRAAARESLAEFVRLGGPSARERVRAEAELEALFGPGGTD